MHNLIYNLLIVNYLVCKIKSNGQHSPVPFGRLSLFVAVNPNGKAHADHMYEVAGQVRTSLENAGLPVCQISENGKTGLRALLIDCPVAASDALVKQYRTVIMQSCSDVVSSVTELN